MENRIVTVEGITLDLARIRAVKTSSYIPFNDIEILHVEYNSRTEYSKNPFTGEIEKAVITDTISKKYGSFQAARDTQELIEACWSDYLNENDLK